MPRSAKDSAAESVPQANDTPVVREQRRPARESGLRGVVITGAVAGIGRATALRFAEEGANCGLGCFGQDCASTRIRDQEGGGRVSFSSG